MDKNTCKHTHIYIDIYRVTDMYDSKLCVWERENGSDGQPAEPPPEVSAAPDWLDPAAQSHTNTNTQNEKAQ